MSADFRAGLIVGALLTAAALFAFAALSSAQVSISVFGASKHSESGYCEVNPGLGVNYQITDSLRFGHGRFENSKCKMSNGTGFVYDPLKLGNFRFGVAVLRLTGYRKDAVYVPLPVGSYAVEKDKFIDFFVATKSGLTVAGAALRFQF